MTRYAIGENLIIVSPEERSVNAAVDHLRNSFPSAMRGLDDVSRLGRGVIYVKWAAEVNGNPKKSLESLGVIKTIHRALQNAVIKGGKGVTLVQFIDLGVNDVSE